MMKSPRRSRTDALVIHHTVTPIATTDVESITRLHQQDRGWSTMGYNALIYRASTGVWTWGTTRGLDGVGAHCAAGNMNNHGCGIAIPGNWSREDAPGCPPASSPPWEAEPEMWAKLLHVCMTALSRFGLGPDDVCAHRDFKATACCGFDVERLRADLRASLEPDLTPREAVRLMLARKSPLRYKGSLSFRTVTTAPVKDRF